MEINNLKAVRKFQIKYPDSRSALDRWIAIAKASIWTKAIDIQSSFPSAEDVKGWTVFNIKGNSYRLITTIAYPSQEIDIHEVMTHDQYDRWKP
jgi:mRNA interferase HigB